MKIVAAVADGSGTVDARPTRCAIPSCPTIEIDGRAAGDTPDGAAPRRRRMLDVEREIREVRLTAPADTASANELNRVTVDRPTPGSASSPPASPTARCARRCAVSGSTRDDDIAAAGSGCCRCGMPMPFDADTVRDFARGLDEIFVVEEKNPTLELLIKDALYGTGQRPRIVGKHDDDGARLIVGYGALDADAITPASARRLGDALGDRLAPEPPRAASAS